MAEFQKVIKERKRMCDRFHTCMDCPLRKMQKGSLSCVSWILNNPEEAEEITMQWAAEHPLVTNGAKFEEIFGVPFWAISCGVTSAIARWLRREYKKPEEQEEERI